MAHVHKQTYTTPVPASATRCTHRGKPAARWKGRGGRVVVGVLCADKPGRCLVESTKWYVTYRDDSGADKTVVGFPDKAATEALMAKLVQQAARVAAGLLPPEAARPRRTLPELLDRWRDYLEADGDTQKHAKTQRLRAARVIAAAEATRPTDLTPGAVVRAVAKVKTEHDLSGRTATYHLGAVKAFTRWLCVTEHYEPTDPLSGISREDDDTDPQLVRRVLSPADFDHFLKTTRRSKELRYWLTGFERYVLYLTASSTGLRASELASLNKSSFDFGRRVVTVKAAYAKGRRLDELDLHPDVIPHLEVMLKNHKPHHPAWPNRSRNLTATWFSEGAKMIRADLAAAGLPATDDAGRVFDFHSLRSQFITDLDRAGVTQARAQKLARHSVPSLTAKHYTRPDRDELAADVGKLKRG